MLYLAPRCNITALNSTWYIIGPQELLGTAIISVFNTTVFDPPLNPLLVLAAPGSCRLEKHFSSDQ